MYKFTQAGTVKKVSGTQFWTVQEPFFWWINYKEQNERIIVHQGFKTDFASVPRLLWFVLNPTEYNAAVLHDFVYKNLYKTRYFCDKIFFQALIAEGCPIWKAVVYFIGVRIGGWESWNNNKK